MERSEIINWLLEGDVSIQYQVYRDLLSEEHEDLRDRIENEGWGAKYLSKRRDNGHWGIKFYQPKWTSSHYTLCDLRNLCISPEQSLIRESIDMIASHEKGHDGGIHPAGNISNSDACINGMFLNYASYFKTDEEKLKPIIDFILSQRMKDGGFNCRLNRSGAVHSSLHTTINVLEGITEYEYNSYTYRLEELKQAEKASKEFILQHQLFMSDKTGEIIHKNFLKFPYPGRWRYDIIRALDYFQYSNTKWDDRMKPALDILINKRGKDKKWKLQANHKGELHFEMEKVGKPSRWNTLRALRILRHFGFSDN